MRIERVDIATYEFPTDEPEADGTLSWAATTAVVVSLHANSWSGLGWTYSSPAAGAVVRHHLVDAVTGRDVADIAAGWEAMHRAGRNLGTRGLYMQALSAVDMAWWDLKARVQDLPLSSLLGRCRTDVPVYGSGGFTTMSDRQLAAQVERWQTAGVTAMKIKIAESWGTCVERDLERVRQLAELAGPGCTLMVDANGGYTIGQAVRVGHALDDIGVTWFEEPVSSDDTAGLDLLRRTLRCDIAAGEYVSDERDARALASVVDCIQLDVTRCGGYTGWLRGAAIAAQHHLQVSAHCAPALHAPIAAAIPHLRHVEWFADHARLEPTLVDGAPTVADGVMRVEATDAGHGMRVSARAEPFRKG